MGHFLLPHTLWFNAFCAFTEENFSWTLFESPCTIRTTTICWTKSPFPMYYVFNATTLLPSLGSGKKGGLVRRVLTPRGKLSTAIYDLLSNSMRVLQTLTEEAQRRLISRFSIGYLMQCLQKPITQKLVEV